VGWAVAYPPGASDGTRLPVLLVLHGRGGDHSTAFGDGLGLDRFLADAVTRGGPAFAIAGVDGSDTDWHAGRPARDAGAMVTDEFVPLLGGLSLDVARVDFLAWSMGGYGSMLLASRLGPSHVAAVAAESPAIWESANQTAPGAFDGPADYEAHTVLRRQAQLARIPLRIDCGTGDPFYRSTKDFVPTLTPRPAGGFQPGGHDLRYWRRMAPAQLAFVGRHLHLG
jgi:enterochelin esterase-like enzyme